MNAILEVDICTFKSHEKYITDVKFKYLVINLLEVLIKY